MTPPLAWRSESGVRAYRQGRIAAVQRWLRWLEDRGETEGHPMEVVMAGFLSAVTGRAAEAERWADVADHWQYGEASGPEDPAAEAWAALLRAVLCQHGVKQMRADADEAARRFAAESVREPAAALMQGVARVLSGDLDGGDASLKNAASVAEVTGAPDVAAVALCERSLVAMARGEWSRARSSRDGHVPSSAGPGRRSTTQPRWSARSTRAPPCTGADVRRHARSWSAPSACGLC